MPALKFTIRGVEFQFIGEQDEITAFLNRFIGENPNSSEHGSPYRVRTLKKTDLEPIETPTELVFRSDSEQVEPLKISDWPLPDDDAIINYIISKPQYIHDLLEIQEKFFGKVFHSRGKDARMYHRTARQLECVRGIIEKRFNGTFKGESAGKRNLRRFVFVKTATISMFNKQQ
jgi:hypothetical protein